MKKKKSQNSLDSFENYQWHQGPNAVKQSLYLSRDANKMCEIVQNSRAQIWHHKAPQRRGGLITWNLLYRIKKNFPFLAT